VRWGGGGGPVGGGGEGKANFWGGRGGEGEG